MGVSEIMHDKKNNIYIYVNVLTKVSIALLMLFSLVEIILEFM